MPNDVGSTYVTDTHGRFTDWARSQGCFIGNVLPTAVAGKGLGINATKTIQPGEVIISVPQSTIITRKSFPKAFLEGLEDISIHGALAAYLLLDSQSSDPSWPIWMSTWPSREDFIVSNPVYWDAELQDCLPEGAQLLLKGQQRNLSRDWAVFQSKYPRIMEDAFMYYWMIVNTRSFYYEFPGDERCIPREDRMALCPFVDYFNHSDQGCHVSFTPNGFEVKADREYVEGEEVHISYGNHSNDFLLAEYGFIMDSNRWDEIKLDGIILPQFPVKQKEKLKHAGFLGNYVLDRSEICYRTEVAIRRLILPSQAWQRFVNGMNDGDGEQERVNRHISRLLEGYQQQIKVVVDKIEVSDQKPQEAHNVLLIRWTQISAMVQTAIQRLK